MTLERSSYLIPHSATIRDAMQKISGTILTLLVTDEREVLVGTLTDGDIRRGLLSGSTLDDPVETIMHTRFHALSEANLSVERIRQYKQMRLSLVPFLRADGTIEKVYDFSKQKSLLPIDAVIMAGGRGERLRPLTDTTPKPLLNVGGRAIIDHNIARLKDYGVERFYVTVNYLGEQIVRHFEESALSADCQITCLTEPAFLGTVGAVGLITEFNHDTVLIMNSDLFTNIDYEAFYAEFIASKADMAIATVPYSVNVPYAIVETEGNCITGLEEKPNYTYYANAGIYLIKREWLSLIPQGEKFQATDLITELICRNKRVIKYPIIGYWIDIGKPDDYKKVQELAKHINY